ncbi:methyltransferase domain-containing protein [Actinoplanes sp. NPDC049596]|uniref:methyltransferase domain-containing protein n=1 Tax=unclassified Actinoplanes TaxID=2626549 RepID=UPI003421535D
MSIEAEWDARYAERVFSGDPNVVLVREVSALPPGRALDLGCGEGGDAIWLARQGWHVTAVDVSGVALARAAEQAGDLTIDWQRHDLSQSFPEGTYDLVSAQFLYHRGEFDRTAVLRRAAAAVAPGGVLLIEGHMDDPHHPHDDLVLQTPAEIVASLELGEGWEVLLAEEHPREHLGRMRTDSTVKLRRA